MEKNIKSVKTDLRAEISELKQSHETTEAEVSSIKHENIKLKSEVIAVRSNISDLEQYSRVNKLIVTGVPVTYVQ